MQIISLEGINIYSFEDFFIDFEDFAGVSTIILGKNNDQKTANGAGKSSILKALYWNLFNKELNKEPMEFIINRNGSNGAITRSIIKDKGNVFQITRYKDYKGKDTDKFKLHNGQKINGTGVEFLINGEPLHGDSHTQTQKIIEQKINRSSELFLSSILMSQNSQNNFLNADDTSKKELLSELLDLQAFAKAFDLIKKEITEIESKITNYETKIENFINQKDNYEKELIKISEEEKKFEENKKTSINNLKTLLENEELELKKLKTIPIKESNYESLENEKKQIELDLKKINEDLSEEPELIKVQITDNLSLKSINEFETNFIENEKTLVEKISLLNSKISEVNISNEELEYNEKIKELNVLKEDKTLLLKQILNEDDLINELINLKTSLNNESKKEEDFQHSLDEILNNNICNACKRKFTDASSSSDLLNELKQLIEIQKKSIKSIKSNIITVETQISEIKKVKNELEIKENLIKELEKKINEVLNKISILKNQEKHNNFIKSEIESTNKDLLNLKDQLLNKNNEKSKIEKRLLKVAKFLEDFKPIKITKQNLELKLKEISDSITLELKENEKTSLLKEKINEVEKNIKKITIDLDAITTNTNPFSDIVVRLDTNIKNLKDLINNNKELILTLQDELKYLNFWKIGFAPTGIRSFITDDVIELLNRKTQENLNDLFDGALSVIFDPESKSGKGVVSNKISTTFLLNGKETKFGLLSGGEQCRAILATNLALTEVAEARSGSKFNLRFLDEPFNGMDDNGQIKSLALFTRLARDKDGFFIISHEEKFQNLCQKALYIIKDNEISRIVDKSEFEKNSLANDLTEPEKKSEKSESKLDKILAKKRKELDDY